MGSGTITADGTEQTVFTSSVNAAGFVFYYLDLSNMASGDTLVIREKADLDNDGTYETIYETTYSDAQAEPLVFQSGNFLTNTDCPVRVTIEQTGGTNRGYDYYNGVKH